MARQVARQLGVRPEELPGLVLRKRSLDCRRGRIRHHLSFELFPSDSPGSVAFGRLPGSELAAPQPIEVSSPARVLIIGDGPCGLFCAYELARAGVGAIVLDRGKPVQPRRHDLKGLTRRGSVDPDSNYCFGEGGAGTYSDGKLYTRSHKRGPVRDVLEILALHGAPPEILVDARPHIGTNKLPDVVTALRLRLQSVGVQFRFGARVVEVLRTGSPERVSGVRLADGSELEAEHIVLATGHSARDIYHLLHQAGHRLEAKSFALGVRIEHPQPLINRIQYGSAAEHPVLPSAAYQLVDSREGCSVFSFCMCPGGFIVPATTEPGHVVVNGMSPSARNSRYANSGLVLALEPESLLAKGFAAPLGGLELQSQIERAAFTAGGGALRAPATRLTDFLASRPSSSVPSSSYVPGLQASDVGEVLDAAGPSFAAPLRRALEQFGRQLRGYVTEEAVLVGVESRTSSPVRIPRDPESLESTDWRGLYPAGEGAGYAGGIVSAAMDGMRIARQIARLAP
ncbi:MAG: FAD-dependent protein [Deltaproteobacteria bacterium]